MMSWVKTNNGLCVKCNRPNERINNDNTCLNCAIKINTQTETTFNKLVDKNLIRLTRQGFGAGKWWQYKEKMESGVLMWTMAISKEEAIKRASKLL